MVPARAATAVMGVTDRVAKGRAAPVKAVMAKAGTAMTDHGPGAPVLTKRRAAA